MRNDRLRIQDIDEAIEEIIRSTPETRAQFDADKFRRSHILRHIQIIGEAAARLSTELRDANRNIPWKEIIGMRHILVHDYFEVNWHRVYETAIKIYRQFNSRFGRYWSNWTPTRLHSTARGCCISEKELICCCLLPYVTPLASVRARFAATRRRRGWR